MGNLINCILFRILELIRRTLKIYPDLNDGVLNDFMIFVYFVLSLIAAISKMLVLSSCLYHYIALLIHHTETKLKKLKEEYPHLFAKKEMYEREREEGAEGGKSKEVH